MNDTRQLIVVVEEDAGMRRALQRLLRVSGFDTLLFDSAEAFLSANDARVPHCLLLTFNCPVCPARDFTNNSAANVLLQCSPPRTTVR